MRSLLRLYRAIIFIIFDKEQPEEETDDVKVELPDQPENQRDMPPLSPSSPLKNMYRPEEDLPPLVNNSLKKIPLPSFSQCLF